MREPRDDSAVQGASTEKPRAQEVASSALIWRIERGGSACSFNGAWERFTGSDPATLAGLGWLEAVHPEDRQGARSLAVSDGAERLSSLEMRVRGRDGRYCWFLAAPAAGFEAEDASELPLVAAIPIEARRAAEAERDAELADLQAMLQNLPAMIWRTTADGAMDYANDRYLTAWGQTFDEIKGWGWKESVHPDDRQGLVDYWAGHLSSDADGLYEFRVGAPDRDFRWYLSMCTPGMDAHGKVLRWYGATFDIEDRKQAEDRLRRSEAFLRQGQLISKTGGVAANFVTGEHAWSEETYRILELDAAVTPSFEAYLHRAHPEDLELVRGALDLIRGRERNVDFEHRLRMPDGRIKHLRVLVNPSHAGLEDGASIGVIMDVTATKVAEEEMHRAQAELTRVSRIAAMAELTASIAHEINQPLSGILTNSEACLRWINRPEPDVEEAREAIERAVVGAQRVNEVVRQLRAIFTRKGPDALEIDLTEVVSNTLPLLRSHLNEHRATVSLELAPHLPTVVADPVQIQQVLINFVTNALQAPRASERDGRHLIVTTTWENDNVGLSVSDDGPGLDAAQLPHLFEPFFTTKSDGMGMGLSICRSIVESHGGQIFARNREVGGAVVGFSLPARPLS
jgi:PAS domain S-box-containing protein